ncbi:hypothetical protein [Arenimonas donghaensis]|uniref:Uncharacterized protein n=1 Tax=Arenimonas donghaensis DSM 18148 = HO3-R19 TaxID=1121014 RepID=A0A087MK32_9GAMM|nr:hypothetical protein [Arenimonas donghaensis]KFL37235.1 hypothetical protein N788_10370 [Arenimonas donghaensis DSM 18148 = HO3-R19]
MSNQNAKPTNAEERNHNRDPQAVPVDASEQERYWRGQYEREPYFEKDYGYDDYGPAYKVGWDARARAGNRSFEDAEADMRRSWEETKGKSRLAWEKAKGAAKAAWNRVERAMPGDADNDGK